MAKTQFLSNVRMSKLQKEKKEIAGILKIKIRVGRKGTIKQLLFALRIRLLLDCFIITISKP